MHFKRYNLVIISSEWIGAVSYYQQLTSEITRRILTTLTAQSVLTFFSTSNSIFIVSLLQHGLLSSLSFFSEDPTLPLHLIRIRSVCYCGMARHWKRGVAELPAIHLLFQEDSVHRFSITCQIQHSISVFIAILNCSDLFSVYSFEQKHSNKNNTSFEV